MLNRSGFSKVGLGMNSRRMLSFKRPSFSISKTIANLKLKPQPAGYIVGTVNDAYLPPPPDYYHGLYHWSYDRIAAILMIPLTITPFVSGVATYPLVDSLLGTLLVVHCKAGFESCIIDYIPKRVYGLWHTFLMRLLTLGSWVSLYGLYLLETKSNGLTDLIIKIWGA